MVKAYAFHPGAVEVGAGVADVEAEDHAAGIGIVPRSAIEASDLEQVGCVELAEEWARRALSVCVRPGSVQENQFLRALVDQLCAPVVPISAAR